MSVARSLRSGTLAFCGALSCAIAADAAPAEAPAEQAEIAPLAAKSMLLDAAYAGTRMVVVGEHGHVLLSDDQGVSWRQAPAPTLSTLTAVHFADATHGCAVGHDEVILCTEDGGEHWTRVHFEPKAAQPLLDIWFRDVEHGIAVGAYSAYYVTSDGGRTWQAQSFAPLLAPSAHSPQPSSSSPSDGADVDEGMQFHLNGIAAAPGGRLYLAAEAGHLYRSDDGGTTWITLKSPYEGSFFGVLALDGDALLAFGMRGHLYRSDNAGADWSEIATDVHAMLTSAVRMPQNGVAVTGLGGVLLVSNDGGHSFRVEQQADRKGMSSALLVGERLLTVGEGGVLFRTL